MVAYAVTVLIIGGSIGYTVYSWINKNIVNDIIGVRNELTEINKNLSSMNTLVKDYCFSHTKNHPSKQIIEHGLRCLIEEKENEIAHKFFNLWNDCFLENKMD